MTTFIPAPAGRDTQSVAQPFSGHERNRLFLQGSSNFDDVSLVSGADIREDGRGFTLIDFDKDGWLDIAATSPNSPKFKLLRNTIGDDQPNVTQHVYLKLVGGATQAKSQQQWSPRDAIGASVLVRIGNSKRRFQLSSGEGLSTQNGKWIHVGLGKSDAIDELTVSWPSGKQTIHLDIKAGENQTLFENATESQVLSEPETSN